MLTSDLHIYARVYIQTHLDKSKLKKGGGGESHHLLRCLCHSDASKMYLFPNGTHSFCLPSPSSHQMWFSEDSRTEFLDRRAYPGALGFPRPHCARDISFKTQN